MLRKLLATVARRELDRVPADPQPAELLPEALRFKPMVPLQPPPAQNDDVMHQVYEEVEKALRTSGNLH